MKHVAKVSTLLSPRAYKGDVGASGKGGDVFLRVVAAFGSLKENVREIVQQHDERAHARESRSPRAEHEREREHEHEREREHECEHFREDQPQLALELKAGSGGS